MSQIYVHQQKHLPKVKWPSVQNTLVLEVDSSEKEQQKSYLVPMVCRLNRDMRQIPIKDKENLLQQSTAPVRGPTAQKLLKADIVK